MPRRTGGLTRHEAAEGHSSLPHKVSPDGIMVPNQEPHQGNFGHVDGEGEGLLPNRIEPCQANRTHFGKQVRGECLPQFPRGTGHSSSNENSIMSVIKCDISAPRTALKTKWVCWGPAGIPRQAAAWRH